MQSPKKGFQLQTDSHTILTTFQPSHIDFAVTNRSTGVVQKGHFYDSTLPASVKEQCQAVSDLYDFLEGKLPSEMQVDQNSLKFKVVRIKKERWYSLAIQDEAEREPLKSEYKEERIPQKMEEQVNNIGLLSEKNEELYRQNEQLRREVERLNTINAQLQSKIHNNELQALYHVDLEEIDEAMELEWPQENKEYITIQQYHPIQPSPAIQKHTLVVADHRNPHYKLQDGIITKETDQASVLCFQQCIQECIQKGQPLILSIQVLSLANGWIIFGILPKELQNNALCYINKDVFAYSGSMNFIINDFNTIDLDRRHQLTEGDTISLRFDFLKKTVKWHVDGKQAYNHPLSDKIMQKEFYPFLMLSQPGDSVRVNCQE